GWQYVTRASPFEPWPKEQLGGELQPACPAEHWPGGGSDQGREPDLQPHRESFERGYGFTLTNARNVSNVRAYVNTMPNQFIMDRAFTASIYPSGYEDQSGPVRRVIIPCTGGFVTGADPASWTFIDVSDVASAFWNLSSQQAII